MGFKKGEGGRPQGAVNQTTKLVKEVFNEVFTDLQNHPKANLKQWAISEPTEFYKLASKLIPTQMNLEANVIMPSATVNVYNTTPPLSADETEIDV